MILLVDRYLSVKYLDVEMEYELGGGSHNTAIVTFFDVEAAEAAICE